MLTQSLQKKLHHVFVPLNPENGCMNLKELEGFMHAIAITPDIIQPSEWLPKIFNDQMPEYESMEQAESTMGVLMDSYAHYNEMRIRGKLSYNYDVKQLSTEMFDDIMNWVWGFLTGLRLRMPIWMNQVVSKELEIDEDPVINSLGVIEALVDKELDTKGIVKKMRDSYEESGEYMSEDEWEPRLIADLIAILPEAVSVLQTFGEGMDERRKKELHKSRPVRSSKIGRNEACPCGSGKKYKKCCALKVQEGYLH